MTKEELALKIIELAGDGTGVHQDVLAEAESTVINFLSAPSPNEAAFTPEDIPVMLRSIAEFWEHEGIETPSVLLDHGPETGPFLLRQLAAVTSKY